MPSDEDISTEEKDDRLKQQLIGAMSSDVTSLWNKVAGQALPGADSTEPKPVVNQKIDETTAIALTLVLALISIFIAWWLMKRSNRVPHATDKVRFNVTTPPEIDPEEVEKTAREHLRDLASREVTSDP